MSGGAGLLWVTRDDTSPHPYLVESARPVGRTVRELHWAKPRDGERSFGRFVEFGGRKRRRENPMSVKLVSPRMLIEGVAAYRREFGPCMLWVIGDGPERASLVELAGRLQVEDLITFPGPVEHEVLKGAFEACQAFVFPTLQDFVGRVAVEALTAGTPLVVSPITGAVGTIVHDGVNGIVVDPRDPRALARAMHRLADPETSRTLREGVRQTNSALHPDAAADVVLSAVARVQGPRRGGTETSDGPR